MHIYSQKQFDALPVVENLRQCPTGDYRAIKNFGAECRFGAGGRFGEWCSFGESCSFEDGHKAAPGNPYIAFDRCGGGLRKSYFWHFEDGIYVRAGCFFGTLEQFRAEVARTHGDSVAGKTYQMFADIAELTFNK